MKTCVYAICKNESKFVERWLNNMWNEGHGADYICVLDTGSDDGTYELLRQCGDKIGIGDHLILGQKVITPWRFDVARNESMKLIPEDADILVCTDLDETLIPDFWADFKACAEEHPDFGRIMYKYAWSHDSDGKNDMVFWYDKTTSRNGWKWEYPVHEVLTYIGEGEPGPNCWLDENKVYLHHWPDNTKSRGSYLGLLELRANENPEDVYGLYYLGREYSFRNQYDYAIATMTRLYVRLNEIGTDDMCMMPGICANIGHWYELLGMFEDAEFWYKKGIDECYWTSRELGIRYAQMLAYRGRSEESKVALETCLAKSVKVYDWRNVEYLWDDWKVRQIKAVNACWEGNYEEAEKEFIMGLIDIRNDTDKWNATNEGFYSDKAWLEEKLGYQIDVRIDRKYFGGKNE